MTDLPKRYTHDNKQEIYDMITAHWEKCNYCKKEIMKMRAYFDTTKTTQKDVKGASISKSLYQYLYSKKYKALRKRVGWHTFINVRYPNPTRFRDLFMSRFDDTTRSIIRNTILKKVS